MAEIIELIAAAGNAGTAFIAYMLWQHELRLKRLEDRRD